MNVTLFMPVLNERGGLEQLMPRIPKNLLCQILMIDGGSTDGSYEWAKENGIEVYRQEKKGLRHAYVEGFPKIKGEWVITFSPDGNCLPEDIAPMIEAAKNADVDVVFGSRYFGNAKSGFDDLITKFGNFLFTQSINTFFKAKYSDAMNIFRMYRTKTFYDLGLDSNCSYFTEHLFFTVMGIEPLLAARVAKYKLRYKEIFTFEGDRIYGVRKLQIIRWGCAYLSQIIFDFFAPAYWWEKLKKNERV